MSAINTVNRGKVMIVYFNESRLLDGPVIDQIGEGLKQVVDRTEHGKLLLNFEHVRFMASAMLGKIVLVHKRCKADDITLKLCSISDEIMEVFKLMKLHKLLDIYADEARTVKSFEKKGFFS